MSERVYDEASMEAIKEAVKSPLSVEIIAVAMAEIKNNPSLTIPQAITMGFLEWDT